MNQNVQSYIAGIRGLLFAAVLGRLTIPVFASDYDSCRIVMFRVPRQDATAVRTVLEGDKAAMDGVLKRQGVTLFIDRKESSGAWDRNVRVEKGGNFDISHVYAGVDSSMGAAKAEGPLIEISPEKRPNGVFEQLRGSFVNHRGQKGLEVEEAECNPDGLWLRPDVWQEICSWGDTATLVMVWQFGTISRLPDKAPDRLDYLQDYKDNHVMETRLLLANKADLDKLTKSEPSTRETAMTWLAGRAKLVYECRSLVLAQSGCSFGFRTGQLDGKKPQEVVDNPFSAEKGSGKKISNPPAIQTDLHLNWFKEGTAEQILAGKIEWSIGPSFGDPIKVAGTMDAGVWNFLPVPGCAEVNVMAYRLTRK